MSLEERVKALEEWRDAMAGAMLGQPVEPKKEKEYFRTEGLTWTQMPATPTNKGAWEKCVELDKLGEIIGALESAGRQLFSKNPDALYWLMKDRESEKVMGVGRRKK